MSQILPSGLEPLSSSQLPVSSVLLLAGTPRKRLPTRAGVVLGLMFIQQTLELLGQREGNMLEAVSDISAIAPERANIWCQY